MKIMQINDHQRQLYEDYEKVTAGELLAAYQAILDGFIQSGRKIRILDVGGASGHFAMALCDYFRGQDCEITVIDTCTYATWEKFGDEITFMQGSAADIERIFAKDNFDLIFANRLFHHLVRGTWNESRKLQKDVMRQCLNVLERDGYFCMTDFFYDGMIFDESASRMIYRLTSCKNPLAVSVFRRIESKSVGVGVCMLSRKMTHGLIDSNDGVYMRIVNEGSKYGWGALRKMMYSVLLLIRNAQNNVVLVVRYGGSNCKGGAEPIT